MNIELQKADDSQLPLAGGMVLPRSGAMTPYEVDDDRCSEARSNKSGLPF